eukprot:scaffold416298_cov34-Prasinocladus_malaysianus.AAC.2
MRIGLDGHARTSRRLSVESLSQVQKRLPGGSVEVGQHMGTLGCDQIARPKRELSAHARCCRSKE